MTTPALTSVAERLARRLSDIDHIDPHLYFTRSARLMEVVGPALAEAWQDGRDSVARDLMADRGEDGMIHATLNPYKEDPR